MALPTTIPAKTDPFGAVQVVWVVVVVLDEVFFDIVLLFLFVCLCLVTVVWKKLFEKFCSVLSFCLFLFRMRFNDQVGLFTDSEPPSVARGPRRGTQADVTLVGARMMNGANNKAEHRS